MTNPLKPDTALLCKLGSIVVHADEYTEPGGHAFDVLELRHLLEDPDVAAWLSEMSKLGMVPMKRR